MQRRRRRGSKKEIPRPEEKRRRYVACFVCTCVCACDTPSDDLCMPFTQKKGFAVRFRETRVAYQALDLRTAAPPAHESASEPCAVTNCKVRDPACKLA